MAVSHVLSRKTKYKYKKIQKIKKVIIFKRKLFIFQYTCVIWKKALLAITNYYFHFGTTHSLILLTLFYQMHYFVWNMYFKNAKRQTYSASITLKSFLVSLLNLLIFWYVISTPLSNKQKGNIQLSKNFHLPTSWGFYEILR